MTRPADLEMRARIRAYCLEHPTANAAQISGACACGRGVAGRVRRGLVVDGLLDPSPTGRAAHTRATTTTTKPTKKEQTMPRKQQTEEVEEAVDNSDAIIAWHENREKELLEAVAELAMENMRLRKLVEAAA